MTLEEIKKLDNNELGGQVTALAGFAVFKSGDGFAYWKENRTYLAKEFCCSLDKIAEIEKIVIEKFGYLEYSNALLDVFGIDDLARKEEYYSLQDGQYFKRTVRAVHGTFERVISKLATATARQRAEACLLALSGQTRREETK